MGWSFDYHDVGRKAFIERITSQAHFSAAYKLLESRVVGNHVWHLLEHEGRKSIALDLIAKQRGGGWGEKGMDETWGPYHYDCPLSLLDKADPPANDNAAAWRQKVRDYHEAKRNRPKPVAGLVVELCQHQYRLLEPHWKRGNWVAERVSDGERFRLSPRYLNQSKVIA